MLFLPVQILKYNYPPICLISTIFRVKNYNIIRSLVFKVSDQLSNTCGDNARARVKYKLHNNHETFYQYFPVIGKKISNQE